MLRFHVAEDSKADVFKLFYHTLYLFGRWQHIAIAALEWSPVTLNSTERIETLF